MQSEEKTEGFCFVCRNSLPLILEEGAVWDDGCWRGICFGCRARVKLGLQVTQIVLDSLE